MNSAADTLKQNLSKLLELSGWSQAELARRSGIPQPQIARYFGEKARTPDIKVLDRIAVVFGVSVSALFQTDEISYVNPPHTLQDCLESVNKALAGKPVKIELQKTSLEMSHDPEVQEGHSTLISLSALDKEKLRGGVLFLKSLLRGAEAEAAGRLGKKAK